MFNNHTKILYDLLRQLEGKKFHKDINDPLKGTQIPHLTTGTIQDSKAFSKREKTASPYPMVDGRGMLNGLPEGAWKEGQRYDINYEGFGDMEVKILSLKEQREKADVSTTKEVPVWMKTSTVFGGGDDAHVEANTREEKSSLLNGWNDYLDFIDEENNEFFEEEEEVTTKKHTGGGRWATKRNDEVIKILCQFEKNGA